MQSFKLLPINSVAEAIYNNHVKGKPDKLTPKKRYNHVLTEDDVCNIKILFFFKNKTITEIAEALNINYSVAYSVVKRKSYKTFVAPFEKVYLKRGRTVVDINYEYDVDSLVQNG